MVLLSLLALSFARDERMGVLVLPALDEGSELVQALQQDLAAQPGFRPVFLDEEALGVLAADPLCREQPDCLEPLLPAGTELVLDARVDQVDGQVSADLRLLRRGQLSRRVAAIVPQGDVEAFSAEELPLLLRGWARDERLYVLATQGNSDAAQQLQQRFPESPYTRAWLRSQAQ